MSRIFGAITQNGYVVRNIEAAMRHWIEVLGVGPWFYVERAPIENFEYHGEPSPVDVSIALANSGALQIELIQQRNDAPSMYRDFLQAGHEGLQHVAYWTKTFEADLERILQLGYTIGQEGHVGTPGRFAYLSTEAHPGTVVELSDNSGPKGRMFERIAEAARGWDGHDPIRTVWPIGADG
ncbi:VOC family protein [Candidatus Entotheonella palauensis]|uniref:Glyoxalase n=1 Tax=Candidatus Entotheonella gemina TaxID=1429439 RepID=W4L9A1_9BACT|nr:VOC family protein [Candidatus Entotheonella palauensis]ETW94607.1 MAG: glyoxalase [Candidatus Entotheonella gemina]